MRASLFKIQFKISSKVHKRQMSNVENKNYLCDIFKNQQF